ncbi:MAG: cyclic nucleotide-binding domain-containing protein [Myxococcota bacterium]
MRIEEVVADSRAGRRPVNEDAVLHLPQVPLLAVADGLGGGGAGDIAAQTAMDCLKNNATFLSAEAAKIAEGAASHARLNLGRVLESSVQWAHMEIQRAARQRDRHQMATALLTAVIAGSSIHIAHVGNCRAYLLRRGRLRQLTQDHTVAAARKRRNARTKIDPVEQRRLTQIVGMGDVDVDLAEVELADGDVVILCSDGVFHTMHPEQLRGQIDPHDLGQSAAAILSWVAQHGEDNLSLVMARVGANQPPASADEVAELMRATFLFCDLEPPERFLVAPYLEARRYRRGEFLVQEGEPGGDFYVLVEGAARVTRNGLHLLDLGAGNHFGELTLARPSPRSASVRALEDVRAMVLSRERFLAVSDRRPALGAQLALALLDTVGQRLRDLTDRVARAEAIVQTRPEDTQALLAALRGQRRGPGRS